MLSYCFICEKETESKNSTVVKINNGRIMLLSNCVVCNRKKSRFIKKQEVSWLLSSLRIKTPSSKVPLVGPILL